MDSQHLTVLNARLGRVRRETLNGRPHLVAPFVSLRQQVLAGSKGPLFYPQQETEANPGVWNHIPLTIGHPADPITNLPLSARAPEVVNRVKLGEIYNDHAENGERKGEAWFDEGLTKNKAPRIWRALSDAAAGKRVPSLQLSTGVYTTNVPARNGASYKGTPFTHVATDLKPDHLAVFEPGTQRGACSVEDGCAVLLNEANPDQARDADGRFAAGPDAGRYTSSDRASLSGGLRQSGYADAARPPVDPTTDYRNGALHGVESPWGRMKGSRREALEDIVGTAEDAAAEGNHAGAAHHFTEAARVFDNVVRDPGRAAEFRAKAESHAKQTKAGRTHNAADQPRDEKGQFAAGDSVAFVHGGVTHMGKVEEITGERAVVRVTGRDKKRGGLAKEGEKASIPLKNLQTLNAAGTDTGAAQTDTGAPAGTAAPAKLPPAPKMRKPVQPGGSQQAPLAIAPSTASTRNAGGGYDDFADCQDDCEDDPTCVDDCLDGLENNSADQPRDPDGRFAASADAKNYTDSNHPNNHLARGHAIVAAEAARAGDFGRAAQFHDAAARAHATAGEKTAAQVHTAAARLLRKAPTGNSMPTLNRRFWRRALEALGFLTNAGTDAQYRHQETGQYLPKSGISDKQFAAAVKAGYAHRNAAGGDQPEQTDPDDDGLGPNSGHGRFDTPDGGVRSTEAGESVGVVNAGDQPRDEKGRYAAAAVAAWEATKKAEASGDVGDHVAASLAHEAAAKATRDKLKKIPHEMQVKQHDTAAYLGTRRPAGNGGEGTPIAEAVKKINDTNKKAGRTWDRPKGKDGRDYDLGSQTMNETEDDETVENMGGGGGCQSSAIQVDGKATAPGKMVDALPGRRVENESGAADDGGGGLAPAGTGMSGDPIHLGPTAPAGNAFGSHQFPPQNNPPPKAKAPPPKPPAPAGKGPAGAAAAQPGAGGEGPPKAAFGGPPAPAPLTPPAAKPVAPSGPQPFPATKQPPPAAPAVGAPASKGPMPVTNSRRSPMTLTEKQRREAVGYLTVNCECWKGAEGLLGNKETFPDDLLVKLVRNTQKTAADGLVANAARRGVKIGDGVLTFDAEGQAVFNAKAEGSNADVGASGGTATEANDSALHEEDVDSSVEGGPDVGGSMKKGGLPGGTNNARKPVTLEGWLAGAPAEVREIVRNSKAVIDGEKRRLVDQLVQNYAQDDPDRLLEVNSLLKLGLDDLKRKAKGLPRFMTANAGAETRVAPRPEPVYGARPRAAAPDLTDNSGEDADILPIPTMNWGVDGDKRARA